MTVEYEAKFLDIDKEALVTKLQKEGAILQRAEYLQRRVTFNLPKEKRFDHTWLRVRDEGDKVTLALKSVRGSAITDQKETLVTVDSFEDIVTLLEAVGCERKSYQESKRELWMLGSTEIAIDTWPFLEPFVEIEGTSEKTVMDVAAKLGFNYEEAVFGTVNEVYKRRYGKTLDEMEEKVLKKFTFEVSNPFF